MADVKISNGRVTYTIYWAIDGSYSLLIPHSRITKWLRRGSSAEVAEVEIAKKKNAKARAITEQAASKEAEVSAMKFEHEAEVSAMKFELGAIKAERQSVKDSDRSYGVTITNDPSSSDIEAGVHSSCSSSSPVVLAKCQVCLLWAHRGRHRPARRRGLTRERRRPGLSQGARK